jgi:hypothetical protein
MVFSAVKAHQFFTEESWDSFKQFFDAYMFEASKVLLFNIIYLLSYDFFEVFAGFWCVEILEHLGS